MHASSLPAAATATETTAERQGGDNNDKRQDDQTFDPANSIEKHMTPQRLSIAVACVENQ
jgi:hypothetical protein